MKTKYRIFILTLISLLIISNLNQIWGCAWSGDVDMVNMSMFNDRLMEQDDLRAYLPTCHIYYGGQGGEDYPRDTSEDVQNIDEWYQQFKGQYSKAQLAQIIYTYSNADLQNFIKNQPPNLLAQFSYILMARTVDDSTAVDLNTWWDEKKQPKNFQPLIDNAKQSFSGMHDKFLKIRYAYLVQKLLHAAGKYGESATWYEKNLAGEKITGTMKYRTLDYYAGALYHLKNFAQSNYLFSKIFDEYPARKFRSYASFAPQEEKDWQGALALAKNDRERETLWFLFGLHSDIVKSIKNIYSLNPSSRYLELLITRAVKMVENSTPEIWKPAGEQGYNESDTFYLQNIYGCESTVTSNEKEQFAAFITEHVHDTKIKNGWLWSIAAAYLKIINHQFTEAKALLAESEKNAGSDTMKIAQTNVLSLVLVLKSNQTITPAIESAMLEMLKKIAVQGNYYQNNAFRFCMQVLKQDYLRQGDALRSALCDGNDLTYFMTDPAKKLTKAEEFFTKKDPSGFDSYLMQHYTHGLGQIIYAQGVLKFYNGDLEGASKDFDRFPGSCDNLPANPFNERIIDCHDCDQAMPQKLHYTMKTLVKKMIELKQSAESGKDSAERSRNYLLLANAIYNTSYFGNNRPASANFLFSDQNLFSGYASSAMYKNYSDNSEALKYYSVAAGLAVTSEAKAQATWMIAKCQLNNFYASRGNDTSKDFVAFDGYQLMKDKYSKTKYYQEVINECEYFTAYLGLPAKVKKE
jgi:hypothetical protein